MNRNTVKITPSLFILLLFCSPTAANAFSYFTGWGGAGLALHNNYDCGFSYGFNFCTNVSKGASIGLQVFSQEYNMYRQSDINDVTGGTVSLDCNYLIVAPQIDAQLTKKGGLHGYVNAGVGLKINGDGFIHEWSNVYYPAGSYFNRTIYENDDLKTIVFRIGLGFTQYYKLGGVVNLSITEDVGVIPFSMNNSESNEDDYAYFKGSLNQFFTPTYFTLRMGFSLVTGKAHR